MVYYFRYSVGISGGILGTGIEASYDQGIFARGCPLTTAVRLARVMRSEH
jgi:hypothetical protein